MSAMQFVIYQDNGGQYHWRLLGDAGGPVAVSAASFGSKEEARLAAVEVHMHAGGAIGVAG
jgi:uncharacterized protein YegP (UPF0339 family)